MLLTGVILLTFALFHHAGPAVKAWFIHEGQGQEEPDDPDDNPDEDPDDPDAPDDEDPEDDPEPEPEPDNRTEWQIKFEDKFTDEVVVTENSYTSPNVSITVEQKYMTYGKRKVVYFVADIYIGNIDCFRTYFANNSDGKKSTQTVKGIFKAGNALVGINGDFCNLQKSGFLVRNGKLYYKEKTTEDICVLYRDGTMETISPNDFNLNEIMEKDPWQSWKFGPALLDKDGKKAKTYNCTTTIKTAIAPRTAIGYYEPGHYCFLVADGRQAGYSNGPTVPVLAGIMEEMGCKVAYNLDGGASSVMSFNGNVISRQSKPRNLGEIALITDFAPQEAEEVQP